MLTLLHRSEPKYGQSKLLPVVGLLQDYMLSGGNITNDQYQYLHLKIVA